MSFLLNICLTVVSCYAAYHIWGWAGSVLAFVALHAIAAVAKRTE